MNGKLIEKIVPAEIREGYTFSKQGIVTNPGKFEGEPIETLYYYWLYTEFGDVISEVMPDEREAFDIDKDSKYVYVEESNDGFVSLVYFKTLSAAEDYQNEREGDDEDDEEYI